MQRCNAEILTILNRFLQNLNNAVCSRLLLSALIGLQLFQFLPQAVSADSDIDIVGKTDVVSTTRRVTGPATGTAVQSARTGSDFHVVVVGLPSNQTVQLELGFAELESRSEGERTFNVTVNEKPALSNFDVVAAAGGPLRSVVKKFTITPDRGFLDFHFTRGKGDALINYITITGEGVSKTITTPAPTIAGRLNDPDEYAVPADQQASFEVESGTIHVDDSVETWSSGVPIGGIGTGKFEILPNGQFANFTINNSWDLPVLRPRGTFLAVAAKASSGGGAARLLYVNPSDPSGIEHFKGYSMVSDASYKGQFPFSSVEFKDEKIPLIVTLEGWSPLIPHDVANSALPAGVINVTVENPAKYPVATAVAFSWEDLSGRGGSLLPGDQHGFSGRSTHQDAATSNVTGFQISSEQFELDRPASFAGNYFVGTPIKGATLTRKLSWNPRTGSIPWWKQFSSRLRLDKIPSSPAEVSSDTNSGPMASTLCVTVNLAPKEVRRIPFIVSWYLPQIVTLDSTGRNPSVEIPDYVDSFGSSAGVASHLAANRPEFRQATESWTDMIDRATVPQWIKSHTLNSLFPIRSNSVLLKNDRFAMLESPADMKGMLGPIDLRLSAGDFLRTMFPQLEKTELNLYARAQDTEGRIPRYVGNIHGALSGFDPQLLGTDWAGPTAAWILQIASYWRETADDAFIEALKPQISKARDFLRQQVSDGTMAEGKNIFAATDEFSLSYQMTWLNSLAAIRAAHELLGENSVADDALIASQLAMLSLENTTGTFAAALAGEFALRQAAIRSLLTDEQVNNYLSRIAKNNFDPAKPVPLMEADGGENLPAGNVFSFPAPLQSYVGSLALSIGKPELGLEPFLRMFQIAYAAQKAPWKQALRYDVPAGARASLKYHRTAMGAWSIWRGLTGALHDMDAQRLYLRPQPIMGLESDMEVPVFTTNFWGWLKYNDTDSTGTLAITHTFGETTVTLSSIATGLDPEGQPTNLVNFTEAFTVEEGATLEFIGWPGKPGGLVAPQKPEIQEPDDEMTTESVSLDDRATSPSADDNASTTSRDMEDGEEMAPSDNVESEEGSAEEPSENMGDEADISDND